MDYGWIEKPKGKKREFWPFSKMQDGDRFHVDPWTRARKPMSDLVTAMAYKLKKSFRMVTHPDRTMTIYCGEPGINELRPEVLSYERFAAWLQGLTGQNAEELQWEAMGTVLGSRHFFRMDVAHLVRVKRMLLHVSPVAFGVEVVDFGVWLTAVDVDTSLDEWWDRFRLLED